MWLIVWLLVFVFEVYIVVSTSYVNLIVTSGIARPSRREEVKKLNAINNITEQAIGWVIVIKEQYRTMRGYKRDTSILDITTLTGRKLVNVDSWGKPASRRFIQARPTQKLRQTGRFTGDQASSSCGRLVPTPRIRVEPKRSVKR